MAYLLYGRYGWGSALVEAQLEHYQLAYEFREVPNLFTSVEGRESLAKLNPIAQVPTLVLPDGRIMTESAAITLHLADITQSMSLVPPPQSQVRADFLRWLVFLVANIYPTFTFADDPKRFIADELAGKAFRAAVDAYAERLWRIVADAARGPWFLGEIFSAIDIYVAVMTQWQPRRPWFASHAPKLAAIAARCDEMPILSEVMRRNFPQKAPS